MDGFIRENPIRIDDLGGTPIFGNTHIGDYNKPVFFGGYILNPGLFRVYRDEILPSSAGIIINLINQCKDPYLNWNVSQASQPQVGTVCLLCGANVFFKTDRFTSCPLGFQMHAYRTSGQ